MTDRNLHGRALASAMSEQPSLSLNFYSFDARGHGRSEGPRGDAPGTGDLVKDLELYLELLAREAGVKHPILLGHSMGGLIAMAFCLKYSNQWHVRALITSGTAIRPHLNTEQRVKKAVGQVLARFVPELALASGLPPTHLSHDPRVARSYEQDPLTHSRLSIRFGLSLLETGEDVRERAGRLKIPGLIQHGEADMMTDMGGSLEFYQRCGSSDRELQLYPGLYHEIYNETVAEREKVLSDLKRWIFDGHHVGSDQSCHAYLPKTFFRRTSDHH